jgi:hypothetical protein
MKKLCMMLSLVVVMAASNLFASLSVTLIDNTSSYSKGLGGEFRAVGNSGLDSLVNWSAYSTKTSGKVSSTTDGSSWGYNSGLKGDEYFQTFCLEASVSFTPGVSYNVSISQDAVYPNTPPDPISIGTAWLYSQFAAGTLSGYNYTYGNAANGRTTSAGLLQQAIWWLEGETGGVRDSFINTVEIALYGASGTNQDKLVVGNANGKYGVYALDLGPPGYAQDQLIIVPEPATMLAGTLLLLPFGARILGNLLKRKRPVDNKVLNMINHVPGMHRYKGGTRL